MNKSKQQVIQLTNHIKENWKKSVESLITIGQCLHELKNLFDTRELYLVHLKSNLGMSEMQAHRLIQLYLKFKDKKSSNILKSKPSVLYLIASNLEIKKLETLANGGKVKVKGSLKAIHELSIDDIHSIKQEEKRIEKVFDVDENERDFERSMNAHRRFATFIEEINDWANDLERYQSQNVKIENKELLTKYVEETIVCLEKLQLILM